MGIKQWGNALNVASSTSSVKFPIKFNSILALATSYYNDGTDSLYTGYVSKFKSDGFEWNAYKGTTLSNVTSGVGIIYMAVGK